MLRLMDFLKCCRSRIRRRAGGTRVFQACVSFGTKLLCQYAGLPVEGTTRAGGTRVRSETLRPAGIGAGASEWSGGGALRPRSLCTTRPPSRLKVHKSHVWTCVDLCGLVWTYVDFISADQSRASPQGSGCLLLLDVLTQHPGPREVNEEAKDFEHCFRRTRH